MSEHSHLAYQPFAAMDAIKFGVSRYNEDAGYCWRVLGTIEIACIFAAAILAFHMVVAAQLIFQLDSAPSDSYIYALIPFYLVIRGCAQVVVSKWLLKLHGGEQMSFDEIFSFDLAAELPAVFKSLAASLVFGAFTILGSIVVLVPGLIANSTLRFYKFFIVDRNTDAVEGLHESYEISAPYKGELVNLNIVSTVIKMVGLLVFGVGLIPANAVCGLAEAYAYKKLLGEGEPQQPPVEAREQPSQQPQLTHPTPQPPQPPQTQPTSQQLAQQKLQEQLQQQIQQQSGTQTGPRQQVVEPWPQPDQPEQWSID